MNGDNLYGSVARGLATSEASNHASTTSFDTSSPRDLDTLRAQIAAVLEREHVPGAGIALVDGQQILWTGGVGVADLATGRPVTADTLFRTGSITKSFVALALVKLAEQGRVDLRARVADLAPELAIDNRWPDAPITIAHLLEHTAGFDDMRPNELYGPLAIEAMPLARVLARNPASRVARWRPGSRFSYANPGYTVAAYLIEKVTGRPYEDVLARELFAPLGMTGAALRLTPDVDARLARGYDNSGDAPVPYCAIYHRPAGNLMASPRELAALVKLALARGRVGATQLISPDGMARIERSETARLDAGAASYGLGNGGSVWERAPLRGHDGGIDGFLSTYGYLPAQGVGYVLLVNSTRSVRAVLDIQHLVIEYLLAGRVVAPPPRVAVPEDELLRWTGTYHSAAPRLQLLAFLERLQPGLEVFVDGRRLYARQIPGANEPLELIPLGDRRFRLPPTSAAHITFGYDREGRQIFVADNMYFVEESRARTIAFATVPVYLITILGTGVPVLLAPRRRRRAPGRGWVLCVLASLFATPLLADAALDARKFGELNLYTIGICAATLAFAIGSVGCAVQAVRWLPRPWSILGKLHRLAFALAACGATAYLASYGIIGIRLWSY